MPAPRDVTVRMPTVDEVLPPQFRADILRRAALFAIGRIRRRTKDGKDVNGNALKPYSATYEDRRKRAGFQGTPDLWVSGQMLGSMAVVGEEPNRVLIGFQGSSAGIRFRPRTRTRTRRFLYGTTQTTIVRVSKVNKKTGQRIDLTAEPTGKRVSNALKAYWHNSGAGKNPVRNFFGLSSEDRAFLMKQVLRDILNVVGKLSLTRATRR
jgi:hypothetical protein